MTTFKFKAGDTVKLKKSKVREIRYFGIPTTIESLREEYIIEKNRSDSAENPRYVIIGKKLGCRFVVPEEVLKLVKTEEDYLEQIFI